MTNNEEQTEVEIIISSEVPVGSEGEGEDSIILENVGVSTESTESVLYVEAESLPVPLCPNTSEPPLEYFPFALTASRNNILYVVTETLPVPMLTRTLRDIQGSHISTGDLNTEGAKDDDDDGRVGQSWTPVREMQDSPICLETEEDPAHHSSSLPDIKNAAIILSVKSLPDKTVIDKTEV